MELQSSWLRSRSGRSGQMFSTSEVYLRELGRGSRKAQEPGLRNEALPLLDRIVGAGASGGLVLIKAASAVHLAPVADTDHQHHQHPIEHHLHDAVVPHTHPVDPGFPLKGNVVGRTWILSQQINGGADALQITPLQLRQGSHSTASQANLITRRWLVKIRSHTKPRSTFTCSHGTLSSSSRAWARAARSLAPSACSTRRSNAA